MKKIFNLKYILYILLIFTFIMVLTSSDVMAIGEILNGGKSFISEGNSHTSPIDLSKVKNTSDYIYGILLTVAIIVAVAVGTALGIKLMLGSVEEKAEYKEALLPFVLGCIVVFGAFGIWSIAMKVGKTLDTASITNIKLIAMTHIIN